VIVSLKVQPFSLSQGIPLGDSSIANYDQVSKLSYNFISGSRINLHEVDPEHFDDDKTMISISRLCLLK
jgi:hypothetical protein